MVLAVIICGLLVAAIAAVIIDEHERREHSKRERRDGAPQSDKEKLQQGIEREVASLQLQRAISAALAKKNGMN